jgi:uncharacterized protein YkwD
LQQVPPSFRKPFAFVAVLAACIAGATAGSAAHAHGAFRATAVGDCTAASDWGTPIQSLGPPVLSLVNAHRASLGLSQLRTSGTLTNAALWKARHMAKYGYFGHDDPAPPVARSAFQRIAACGYPGYAAGENIAAGYRSPASVMQAWLASPGHRANIEAPAWTVIGIGVAQSASGALHWVQDFGATDDSGVPPNRVPVAHPDRRSVKEHHRIVIRVLRNDQDPDGDHLSVVTVVKPPHWGLVKIRPNGTIVYVAPRKFVGRDRFRYEVSDGKGGVASAPVIIRIRR